MEYDLASVDYILETTRSVRKRLHLKRPVENEVVMKCLDIALQAPTGANVQGWKWLIVTDSDKKKKIASYYKKAFEEAYGGTSAKQLESNRVASSASTWPTIWVKYL